MATAPLTWDRLTLLQRFPSAGAAFRERTVEHIQGGTLRSSVSCTPSSSVKARVKYGGGEQLMVGALPTARFDENDRRWQTALPGWSDDETTAPGVLVRCDGLVWASPAWRLEADCPYRVPVMFAPGQVATIHVDWTEAGGTVSVGVESPYCAPVLVARLPNPQSFWGNQRTDERPEGTASCDRPSVSVCIAQLSAPKCSATLLDPAAPATIFDVTAKSTVYFQPRSVAAFASLEAKAAEVMRV